MAENIRLINKFGNLAGWNQIDVEIFGRVLEGIEKVEYNDAQAKEWVYGGGDMPIGNNKGNYEATASIDLLSEEIRAIIDSLPIGVRVQDIPLFDVTVSFDYNGVTYKDTIRNCSLEGLGVALSQSDKKSVHTINLMPSHIDWNGNRTNFRVPLP